MIFDQYGRTIKDIPTSRPTRGVQIISEPNSDRETLDVSRYVSPQKIDRIMQSANSGDTSAQCQLARELSERNGDIRHAVSTRRNTLSKCSWDILPGDDTTQAQNVANALKTNLNSCVGMRHPQLGKLDSFDKLLRNLSDALLPGFSAAEIIWKAGGTGFYGFKSIEQRHFSFENSYIPKLKTLTNYGGEELPPNKIVFHRVEENGIDVARGGLIRPLAWLFCFSQINFRDLLSFVERYGMPFVVGKVDYDTWKSEGEKLQRLIQSFGPNGGGVFTRNTELELLQAANNSGDVYFKLLSYLGDSITKVVLGQTASSGDSSGLSGGDAQSQVRQDILEADARALEETIECDLFAPWTRFNYGSTVAIPKLSIATTPPEDRLAIANTIKTLYEAGFQADPQEVSAKVGFKLTLAQNSLQPSDQSDTLNLKQKYDAMGVVIRAGLLTATPEIEEQTRKELGLPAINDIVKKSWDATGGIRQPITLKTAESAAVNEALDVDDEASLQMSDKSDQSDQSPSSLKSWLSPMSDAIDELLEGDDDNFGAKLAALSERGNFGDSTEFEEEFHELLLDNYCGGAVKADERLKK